MGQSNPQRTRIRGIVVEGNDVSFYFDDSDEAFSVVEFVAGTKTHAKLSEIESRIIQFNNRPLNPPKPRVDLPPAVENRGIPFWAWRRPRRPW